MNPLRIFLRFVVAAVYAVLFGMSFVLPGFFGMTQRVSNIIIISVVVAGGLGVIWLNDQIDKIGRRQHRYFRCDNCGKTGPLRMALTDSSRILLFCPQCRSGNVNKILN